MESSGRTTAQRGRGTAVLIGALLALRLAANLLAAGKYGFHREELLHIDMGRHLAWGFLGKPPGIAIVARLGSLLGGSLVGYRIVPIVAGLAAAWLTGLLAKRLGGGRLAQWLATLAVVLWPVSLRSSSFLAPGAFELLWWSIVFLVFVRLMETPSARWWLAWGILWGLSLLNSYGALVVGATTILGMAATGERALLKKAWPWVAVMLAVAIASPHLAWLARHRWAVVSLKDAVLPARPGLSAVSRAVALNMAAMLVVLPLVLLGFFRLLFRREAPAGRPLAWGGLFAVVSLVLGVRPQLVAPAFLPLLAAGTVMVEQARGWSGAWLRRGIVAFVLVVGLVGVPLSIPILQAEATSAYGGFLHRELGLSAPLTWEDGQVHELPQDFADMLGWESLVATVSLIYHSLPPDVRAETAVLAADRGQAGAVNVLGKPYGLPQAVSTDADYFHWGPGPLPGTTLIGVGVSPGAMALHYEIVETAASVVTRFARQATVHVLVCAEPHGSLQELWPLLGEMK
ncbi:MAG: glycosyltransferase family 39 protein [Calditrichaeota bacterium]|nr:glycosyltransferase family 39 protein [Calditrichota bacterium]